MEQNISNKLKKFIKTVPINFGPLKGADSNHKLTGPCGDTMEFWMLFDKEKIIVATYTTDGCEHSVKCGSAAAALVTGMDLKKFNNLTPEKILDSCSDAIPEESNHCALLALNTMKICVNKYIDTLSKSSECTNPGSECSSCSSQTCSQARKNTPKNAALDERNVQQKQNSTDTRTGNNFNKDNSNTLNENSDDLIKKRLSKIKHKITVLSGKGGVGKSTAAVNLSMSLALEGFKVGLLDIDIHGPSVPTMLGLVNTSVYSKGKYLEPAIIGNLKIMSIGFLLGDQDAAVIWRGPMKMSVIKQFVQEVEWGDLDFLIVDCPPGTGDEPLSIVQILDNPDGAVIVTTPQEVSASDVRKSISFCKQLNLPIIGIIENMSGFICPNCKTKTNIFSSGAGDDLSKKFKIPLLGKIPIEPEVGFSGDKGTPFVQQYPKSVAAMEFKKILQPIINMYDKKNTELKSNIKTED
jgi:Mrp family chromosome partitioning ATPase/NifU-like protein involved in Fe-S cluster formation